jgi:hypothetical protein
MVRRSAQVNQAISLSSPSAGAEGEISPRRSEGLAAENLARRPTPTPQAHADQADEADVDAHLFARLPDGRLGRRLTHVDGATHDVPPVVLAGLLDEQ